MKKGLIVLLACTLFVSEGFAVSAQMNSMITKAHDHTVKMCGKSNCQCNC